jgi:hypothetical protein
MGNVSCSRKLIDIKKAYTQRYYNALEQSPAPGQGLGCHNHLLKIANYGARAGIEPQTMFEDIRCHIPKGTRSVFDKEIQDAVNRAMTDYNGGTFTPKARSVSIVKDGAAALRGIINQSPIKDEADVLEKSPIRLWGEPKDDTVLFLFTRFEQDDLIFIGDQYDDGILGDTIRTRDEWIVFFQTGWVTKPFIIINPLSGIPAPMKSNPDKASHRGDNNVIRYRYALVEFDNLSREDQLRFWTAAKLPIVALIDSGGKSIHAWLNVEKLAPVTTAEEWESNIKNRLYDRLLTPLGVDTGCSNPSRLSRLPGHFREEKSKYQRLLWLSEKHS